MGTVELGNGEQCPFEGCNFILGEDYDGDSFEHIMKEHCDEAMKELLEKLVDFSTPKASDVQSPPQSNTFIQSNPTSYRGGSRSAIDPNQGLLGANPYQFYG